MMPPAKESGSRRRAVFEKSWNEFGVVAASVGVQDLTLEIADVQLDVAIAGDPLANALCPPLRSRVVKTPTSPSPVQIRVYTGGTSILTPDSSPQGKAIFVPRGKASPREDEGITVAYAPESSMLSLWDRTTSRGIFWIQDIALLPSWERSAPLVHLLHWLEADHARALVHAAAVGRDGQGLLLVGAGGAGKSTAALACLDNGFDYVADDYCLLSLDEVPLAHNIYGSGKLTPSAIPFFPGLADAITSVRSEDGKSILDIGRHRSQQIVESLALRAVVLPTIGTSPVPPTQVRAFEAAQVLIPSTTLQLSALRPESIKIIADTLRQLPVFRVGFGPDRHEAARQLAALLHNVRAPEGSNR